MGMVLNSDKRLHRIIARYRLWWGFCPRCNSDAPAVDTCDVCHFVMDPLPQRNRRQQYPPSIATKALWWWCFVRPPVSRQQREKEFQDAAALAASQEPVDA